MSLGFWETVASANGDGPALTAAARASMFGTTNLARTGLYTLPANRLRVGDVLHIRASGRLSSVITTPGTARFDLSFGVAGTAAMDTAAIPLATAAARTNTPWVLDVEGIVRAIGQTGNILWQGFWLSDAGLGSVVAATGPGPGGFVVPYNTAPAVGSNVDMTVAQILDFNFTQTVATGSVTLHNYALSLKSSSGF